MAADGRVLVVNKYGELYGIKDGVVIAPLELQGRTIARPAASKSHVFVATTDYLYTLNATATSEIARFPWTAAGVWSPAVGPQGRVYAMAAHILFIFPGPTIYPGRGISLDGAPEVAMG
jgi:hypothetical protein